MELHRIDADYSNWHVITEENAKTQPKKVFIESLDQNKNITFQEMNEWCSRVANFLKAKNITPQDKVTLIGKNSIESMIIYFGTLKYGAILNPIFSEESEENLYGIVNLARPTLVLYDNELKPDRKRRADSEWIQFSEFYGKEAPRDDFFELIKNQDTTFDNHLGKKDDIAEIVYTSGTMSLPKGILISRQALFRMVDEISERTGHTEEERVLEYRAYNWASVQLLSVLSCMLKGSTLFLAKKFSRSHFSDWLKAHKITISSGVPAVINMLVNMPVSLKRDEVPSLKYITSSSAPLTVESHLRFEEVYGIPIQQMMGMSEAGWMAANPPAHRKIGSVGLPLKYKEVYFLDEGGNRCKSGEVGEMIVAGNSMGLGYLNSDGTVTEFLREGFRTGDLGYADEEGYIFITGRKKDLIIRGGINISPMEITTRLLDHAAVQEAATVGAPDKIYGEEVVSFVAMREGFNVEENELIAHCKTTLPDFKAPKKIIFVQALPRNQRGKVAKNDLMKLLDEKRT